MWTRFEAQMEVLEICYMGLELLFGFIAGFFLIKYLLRKC
jgi:hypothetical protein